MNFRVSSASLAGLQGLVWNAFTVASASAAYAKITRPSFTVDKITVVLGAAPNSASTIALTVASGGVAPAWAIPGAAVNVNVTKTGTPIIFATVIRDISANGKIITFAVNPQSSNSITTAYAAASLDAIAGSVVNTITLNIQCQKAMFQVPTGEAANVLVAPTADAAGANAPYSVSLAAGGAEYEVTAPTGSKFDLADFWIKSASATPNLTIRFL